MTDNVKGEIVFDADGKSYTFKLGTNAQVLLEDRIGMSMPKWLAEKGDSLSTKDVRLVMWAGLHRQHGLSEDEVGEIMDSLGNERCAEIFLKAAGYAAAKPNGDARPTQPRATELSGMNS